MLTIDLRIAILYFKPFVNVVKWSHWRLSISSNCYIFVVKVSTCFLWTSFVYCVQELAKTSFKSDCFFCPMVVSCNGLSPTCLGVLLYSHLIMPTLALGLTTKGKTWEGSRLEECSKIQTRSHKVARMSSNTFKWFFSLWELEPHDVMNFWDKSVNNKQSPNQTLFRLLKFSFECKYWEWVFILHLEI
jgi:hypothetical protein